MKSRTSFFNLTLYKKDITRFAPLWVLYTVGLTLLMLSVCKFNNYFAEATSTLNYTVGPLSITNLFYGILAAQLLFGELFNTRLCNALHAMPVTREARFGSHLAAGLSFSIVPNLLVGVLMMPNLDGFWYVALLWVLAMTLEYLFFFGVAVFAMMCTGNRFAAALVYAIINFGSMAALWFASVIFVPLMRGVVLDWDGFANFSPVVKMCVLNSFFDLRGGGSVYIFEWGVQWPYLWICAAVGVIAFAGALLIYRRRALESAGDFMAVKVLKPVFLVLYTLCVGAFLAVFGSIFSGDTYLVFLIVGFVVGFFTGKMLLERTIRVFNLKSFLQLGILVVLMWLSLQAVQWDVFGIVRYVPNPNAVQEVSIQTFAYDRITTSDAEELKQIQQAHTLALEEEGCKHGNQQYYEITYRMKDGRAVKREYRLCTSGKASIMLEKVLASPDAILEIDGEWEDYIDSVSKIYIDGMFLVDRLSTSQWQDFLDCVYEDCDEGLMGKRGGATSRFSVDILRSERSVDLRIRENSATYAWLVEYEKQNVARYRKDILTMTVNGHEVDKKYFIEVVDAMYLDWQELGKWCFTDSSDTSYALNINTGYADGDKIYWVPEYAVNTYRWLKNYLLEQGG